MLLVCSFGTATRDDSRSRVKGPGPANYTIQTGLGRSGPSYYLTPRRPDTAPARGRNVPGPGSYRPESAKDPKRAAPSFSFGTGERGNSVDRTAAPGAGSYQIQSTIGIAPNVRVIFQISLGGHLRKKLD